MKKLITIILLSFASMQAMQDPNPANPLPANNTLDFGRLDDRVGGTILELSRFATNLQPRSLRYLNPKFSFDAQPLRSFYDPLFDTDEYDYSTDLFFNNLNYGNFDLSTFGKLSPRLVTVLIHMINTISKLASYDDAREANPDRARVFDRPSPDKSDVIIAQKIMRSLESAPLRPLLNYLKMYQGHEFFRSYPIHTFINNYINTAYRVEQRDPYQKLPSREKAFQSKGNKFIFPALPQMER